MLIGVFTLSTILLKFIIEEDYITQIEYMKLIIIFKRLHHSEIEYCEGNERISITCLGNYSKLK